MRASAADIAVKGRLSTSADGHKDLNDNNGIQCHIAICGVGIRLPGGIRNTEAFWKLMNNDLDDRISEQESHQKGQSRGGHVTHERFLREGLKSSDAAFFSTTKDTSNECDPYHQKLLEVTHECLEDACEANYRSSGAAVACYVAMPPKGDTTMNGSGYLSASKRLSQQHNFQGQR